MKADKIEAWWFSSGKKLPYGDGRIIKIGRTHKVKGNIELCKNGLHASRKLLDALGHAGGSVIWRVELSGKIKKDTDKLCASSRLYLEGGIDISDCLRKFARMCALDVIHLWDAPKVVVDFLKTGDEKLRAASRAASKDSASWAASCDTSRAASWAASWNASRAASCAASWNASRDSVSWDAMQKKHNRRLTSMIKKILKKEESCQGGMGNKRSKDR